MSSYSAEEQAGRPGPSGVVPRFPATADRDGRPDASEAGYPGGPGDSGSPGSEPDDTSGPDGAGRRHEAGPDTGEDPDLIVVDSSAIISKPAGTEAAGTAAAASQAGPGEPQAGEFRADEPHADEPHADEPRADEPHADVADAGAEIPDGETAAGDQSATGDQTAARGGSTARQDAPAERIHSDIGDQASDGEAAPWGPPKVADAPGGTRQLQERWLTIQSDFVDDPRSSVSAAASLVEEAIEDAMAELRQRESSLRDSWASSGADTEALRKALVGYRKFLDRLAAV
ncbi:MAG TPA: hypothetical protein VH637_01610 [Streptosporangiaceae bacterium]|jgi:hypothetical protein